MAASSAVSQAQQPPQSAAPAASNIRFFLCRNIIFGLNILYFTFFLRKHLYMEEALPITQVYPHDFVLPGVVQAHPLNRSEPSGSAPTSKWILLDVWEATRQREDSIFLVTHFMENLQQRVCRKDDHQCIPGSNEHSTARGYGTSGNHPLPSGDDIWQNVQANQIDPDAGPGCLQRSFWVSNVEKFGIALEHSVRPRTRYSRSFNGRDTEGSFTDSTGKHIKSLTEAKRDVLFLEELMEAAQVQNLYEKTDVARPNLVPCGNWQQEHPDSCCEDFGKSIRSNGMHLELSLQYKNVKDFDWQSLDSWRTFLPRFWEYLLPVDPYYIIKVKRTKNRDAYRIEHEPGCGKFAQTSACPAGAQRDEYRVLRKIQGVEVSLFSYGKVHDFKLYSFLEFVIICTGVWLAFEKQRSLYVGLLIKGGEAKTVLSYSHGETATLQLDKLSTTRAFQVVIDEGTKKEETVCVESADIKAKKLYLKTMLKHKHEADAPVIVRYAWFIKLLHSVYDCCIEKRCCGRKKKVD